MQFPHLSLVPTPRTQHAVRTVRQDHASGARNSPPPAWPAASAAVRGTEMPRPAMGQLLTDAAHVLVVTSHPLRYSPLAMPWDHAADGLTAVAMLRHGLQQGLAYAVILVDVHLGIAGGYTIVRELRDAGAQMPIHLVASYPLPSDRYHAKRSGANGLHSRDILALRRLAVECLGAAGRSKHDAATLVHTVPLPSWYGAVVKSLREFLASEAESQALAIYTELQRRSQGAAVRCADLVKEAAALIDEPGDRASFVRYARRCVCAQASDC
jgi:CheY-like chemotaxis protein